MPQYFVQLYTKVLLFKGEYDKVLDFLAKHEASFGMIVDKKKLVFQTIYKKGDKVGAINALIDIVKSNYEQLEKGGY